MILGESFPSQPKGGVLPESEKLSLSGLFLLRGQSFTERIRVLDIHGAHATSRFEGGPRLGEAQPKSRVHPVIRRDIRSLDPERPPEKGTGKTGQLSP